MKLLAGIMMAVGLLVATTSGACTFYMLVTMGATDELLLGIILVCGAIPFAVGVALFIGGKGLYREIEERDYGS